ncbi:MAG: NADPH-dependent F420 reductase, partial [Steroidobacteraceae bacterium]
MHGVKIGVIGPGAMGEALAGQWVRAGHDLLLAGRTADKASAVAAKIGAKHGSLADAVAYGDVVLLAVRNEGVYATLRQAGAEQGALDGKVIIDCNNPVEIERFTLVTDGVTSMAEGIQATARGASVVKAFNLCQAKVWQMQPPLFDGRPLAVPYCGDDAAAKGIVSQLIAGLGCR